MSSPKNDSLNIKTLESNYSKSNHSYLETESKMHVTETDVGGLSLNISDIGVFTSPSKTSFLNDKYSTIGTFYTNSVKNYDIITTKGISEVVFN